MIHRFGLIRSRIPVTGEPDNDKMSLACSIHIFMSYVKIRIGNESKMLYLRNIPITGLFDYLTNSSLLNRFSFLDSSEYE